MWDKHFTTFALGHEAIDENGVYWSGLFVADDGRIAKVRSRGDLPLALEGISSDVKTILSTASLTLAHSLGSAGENWTSKLVDLTAVVKATSVIRSRMADGSRRRTRQVLARFLCAASAGRTTLADAEQLLEGRDPDPERAADIVFHLPAMARLLARAARRQGEARRIIRFEITAHRALLRESAHPIRFNTLSLTEDVEQREMDCYTRRAQLMLDIELDPHDLAGSGDLRIRLLRTHGLAHPEENDVAYNQFLDLCMNSSNASLRGLAELSRAERQLNSARSLLLSPREGLLPEYDPIGTSTGRIVMRAPGLQWLAKEHRAAVVARDGHSLVYVDYKSFEPNILAICSGDGALLEACHDDLYETICHWLDLASDSREFVKQFFLSFLYGRSRMGLISDLQRHIRITPEDAEARFGAMESQLKAASSFKRRLEREVSSTGKAHTIEGNWRAIPREKSYLALNHYLQGTAALVFKLAIAKLFPPASRIRLIAPMHDAVLAEVPSTERKAYAEEIVSEMQAAANEVLGSPIAAVEQDWAR